MANLFALVNIPYLLLGSLYYWLKWKATGRGYLDYWAHWRTFHHLYYDELVFWIKLVLFF